MPSSRTPDYPAQATAPLLFGLLLERLGTGALAVSTCLLLSAFGVLAVQRKPQAQTRTELPETAASLGASTR